MDPTPPGGAFAFVAERRNGSRWNQPSLSLPLAKRRRASWLVLDRMGKPEFAGCLAEGPRRARPEHTPGSRKALARCTPSTPALANMALVQHPTHQPARRSAVSSPVSRTGRLGGRHSSHCSRRFEPGTRYSDRRHCFPRLALIAAPDNHPLCSAGLSAQRGKVLEPAVDGSGPPAPWWLRGDPARRRECCRFGIAEADVRRSHLIAHALRPIGKPRSA